jgi:hypothetical protein
MKRLIAVLVLFAAFHAHGEDMQKYLSDTQDLVRQGKNHEALERFLWFHDHALEHEPAMYGVRLSFALSYWKELADAYPPALAAMKKTRDDKTAILENKKGSPSLFHDVMSLNRTLKDDGKTIDLFRELDQEQKDLATQCWDMAKDAIIKTKAYDLAKKYIGNPVREFGKVKEVYDQHSEMYGGKNFGESFKAWNENHLVEESLRLIDLSLALDDPKAAKEIQKMAFAIVADYRLRDAIPGEKTKDAQPTNAPYSSPAPQAQKR